MSTSGQGILSTLTESIQQELNSLKAPEPKDTAEPPAVGSKAPSSPKLELPNGKPTIILFLRHCGCPFAEKSFKALTDLSTKHKSTAFIAVSHSDAQATENWIPQVGGAWDADVVVDHERDLYARWGLGLSSTWQFASPAVLWSAYRLGKGEGIWNRATESGSRWQRGGAFAVDAAGVVRWAHVSGAASDLPDLREGLAALGAEAGK